MVLLIFACACRVGFDHGKPGDASLDDANGQLVFDVPFDDTAPVNCPASYQSIGVPGSKYRGVDNSVTWAQAQAACVADGTHLLIINDLNERSVVPALLPTRDLWIGVTDLVALGAWRTVTGDAATYLPWDNSEPDNAADERCVETEYPLFNYIDQDCTSGRRFVCECDGRAADPASY